MPNIRARKVSKQIQSILQDIISGMNDPRFKDIVITEIKITNDLQDATVFFSILNQSLYELVDSSSIEHALAKASGLIRSKLSQSLATKQVPKLKFVFDDLPMSVDKIDDLLKEAAKRDEDISHLAVNSKPVEEDPYKTNDDFDELNG